MSEWTPPEGFKLLKDGGHHEIYCNGTEHLWVTGGYGGVLPKGETIRLSRCRCGQPIPVCSTCGRAA